jgi:nucleoside-diphosphate-sugar epimerase
MGIALLPPAGRVSVIEVGDVAALLLALAEAGPSHEIYEPDDGQPGGWSYAELARAVGVAVGHKVLPVALPKAILSLAAHVDQIFRGKAAKLTADRVGYLCHPDWTASPSKRPDPALWVPQVPTPQGLAATAAWYRANGLL